MATLIVQTRDQAKKICNSKGYVTNYSGFIKSTEKCKCGTVAKSYTGAIDFINMTTDAVNVLTILYCRRCGKNPSWNNGK